MKELAKMIHLTIHKEPKIFVKTLVKNSKVTTGENLIEAESKIDVEITTSYSNAWVSFLKYSFPITKDKQGIKVACPITGFSVSSVNGDMAAFDTVEKAMDSFAEVIYKLGGPEGFSERYEKAIKTLPKKFRVVREYDEPATIIELIKNISAVDVAVYKQLKLF